MLRTKESLVSGTRRPLKSLSVDLRGLQGTDLQHPFHLGELGNRLNSETGHSIKLTEVHLHTTITGARILLEENGCL